MLSRSVHMAHLLLIEFKLFFKVSSKVSHGLLLS